MFTTITLNYMCTISSNWAFEQMLQMQFSVIVVSGTARLTKCITRLLHLVCHATVKARKDFAGAS
jgi:hypothetical protein